ncbi:MAG TPA: Gfo/Idh/MocA family oxidoreductase [Candidatus Paceibacterota bacterium]|nr:Gfo/Idh/MocA family oxidoreductase [Candidatus Paceibacterota bacterium]
MNRRQFLRESLALGGAVALPGIIPARALGRDGAVAPSEKIVVGGLGLGPRGQYDLSVMLPEKDVQFVAVCDAVRSRREQVKTIVDAHYGNQDCRMYSDMFELLGRPDIDAVLIATGDRWHALASLLAAKAGKDVYSEKPCGMTIGEIQSLADGIHRYARVFQAGTQRRSVSNFQYVVHLAQSGKLGRLHTLHASVYVPSKSYAWLPAEPEPPKDQCDWDLWLGPAPWRPYNSRYVSGGWRGHHDFEAGGNFLDWGAHTVDLCQWANQADHTTPIEYEATPTSIVARYANGVELICDFLPTAFGNRDPQYHTSTGTCPVRFEGDEGWVETGDNMQLVFSENLAKTLGRQYAGTGLSSAGHGRNFFDCVRSRALPVCNQNIMRRSHIACFAAQLSWQLGRKLTLDPVKEEFIDDEEANRMRRRATREPWSFNI